MSLITNFKLFESTDESLDKIKRDESYQELASEFDMTVYEDSSRENAVVLFSDSKQISCYIDFIKNTLAVFLEDKSYHDSTFFRLDSNQDQLVSDMGEKQIEMTLAFASMAIMDAVWKYNYDKYLSPYKVISSLSPDNIELLLKGLRITDADLSQGIFNDAAHKYHLLKNLLEFAPQHIANLKYLPNSIDEDDETKQAYIELMNDSPGMVL